MNLFKDQDDVDCRRNLPQQSLDKGSCMHVAIYVANTEVLRQKMLHP